MKANRPPNGPKVRFFKFMASKNDMLLIILHVVASIIGLKLSSTIVFVWGKSFVGFFLGRNHLKGTLMQT